MRPRRFDETEDITKKLQTLLDRRDVDGNSHLHFSHSHRLSADRPVQNVSRLGPDPARTSPSIKCRLPTLISPSWCPADCVLIRGVDRRHEIGTRLPPARALLLQAASRHLKGGYFDAEHAHFHVLMLLFTRGDGRLLPDPRLVQPVRLVRADERRGLRPHRLPARPQRAGRRLQLHDHQRARDS